VGPGFAGDKMCRTVFNVEVHILKYSLGGILTYFKWKLNSTKVSVSQDMLFAHKAEWCYNAEE